MKIEHRTHTREPFDCIRGECRTPGCPGRPRTDGRNHGIGAETVTMVAIGEHRTGPIAVNFTFSSGRYHEVTPRPHWGEPMGYDLGQHASVATYEGMYSTACDWFDGATCYYDGSGLASDEYLKAYQQGGADLVWRWLDRKLAAFADELDADIRKRGGVLR